MRAMSLEAVNEIVGASQHLPGGASLVFHRVDWDDYEGVLENLDERRSLRIDYDSGRLEILSPLTRHGRYDRIIGDLVAVFCDVFQFDLEAFTAVTWKRRALRKGVEPDASFYIQNARRVIGKDIDAEFDPPPDIVVEIDITSRSLRKLAIYSALGIPEVWRYDGQTCAFYRLVQGRYVESRVSPSLPPLTGRMVADAVEHSKTEGQAAARKAFRRTLKSLKK